MFLHTSCKYYVSVHIVVLLSIDCKQSPKVLANIQGQEGSPQEVASQYPTYINLDPDHCHPVKNPAYVHVPFEA